MVRGLTTLGNVTVRALLATCSRRTPHLLECCPYILVRERLTGRGFARQDDLVNAPVDDAARSDAEAWAPMTAPVDDAARSDAEAWAPMTAPVDDAARSDAEERRR